MRTVTVHASTDYPVCIGGGLLDGAGARIRAACPKARRLFVVTDSQVGPLYGGRLEASLRSAGFTAAVSAVPAGERSKSAPMLAALWERMMGFGLTRSDAVAALGGGVVGDLAGFAAATILRGVDFIQIPTTLLSQVDSSVGGKTAIDLDCGKNLAGAFWPPRLVLCDTDTLATLPEDVFADGAAESIKHGLIADRDFFRFLMAGDMRAHIGEVVARNVAIKAAVVGEDEREDGRRKLLNFGHTLGHAVEKCSGYTLTHGRAVAIGMALASRAAERLGYSPAGTLDTVLAACERYRLPTACPYGADELSAAAAGDKKRAGGHIDVVVLEEIGRAGTVRLDSGGLRAFVEAAL